MKKLVTVLALLAILGLGVRYFGGSAFASFSDLFKSPCERPLSYRAGTIDNKFGITQDELLADMKQSAQIWNKALGKNIFAYDPSARLTVSMVYDERQSLTSKISQLEGSLDTNKNGLQPQIDQYNKDSAAFEQRLRDFNSRVDFWNSQGGAPPDEYKKLTDEQNQLRAEAQRLQQVAASLNLSTDKYNAQVGQLNKTIDTLNEDLTQKPEEGIFIGPQDKIEIYFNTSKGELVHTIAHEFGHALGLGHVSGNPKSIMYPYTTQSTVASSEDVGALNSFCASFTPLSALRRNLSTIK